MDGWNVLLWGGLVVLQYFDITSTREILQRGGVELNPFVRFLMKVFDDWWEEVKFLLITILGGVLALYCGVYGAIILALLNAFYLFVVIRNYQILKGLR